MKRILLFITALTCYIAFGQAPQGFSYQAVAFDNNGEPVRNTSITVKISIINNTATGTILFSETHSPTTNDQGLFNLAIGKGSSILGNFEQIDWGDKIKFIKLEIDIQGGSNFVDVGTSQLMSVPYALYAENSKNSFWEEKKVDTISLKNYDKTLSTSNIEIKEGNLHIAKQGEGVILTSPNGTKFKLTISDNGVLSVINNETGEPVGDDVVNDSSDQNEDIIELNGVYTSDLELDVTKEYVITGPTIIDNCATLTIPAGTTIKANKGDHIFIAVKQCSKIKAEGTASEPIIFTSNSNNPEAGDWGGIVLLGRAPINSVDGTSLTTLTSNIYDFQYGGDLETDDSGILSYVRIEYTGGRVSNQLESNAITLYGVGNATTIHHLQIYETKDDAFEFHGGTVNASFISTINIDDDAIDWTEGYTGNLSDIHISHNIDGDKAFECDGYNTDTGNNSNPLYYSSPTISNVTIESTQTTSGNFVREAIRLRAGTQALFDNMVIIGHYDEGFDIDGDTVNNPTGQGVLDNLLQATNIKFIDVVLKVKNDTGVNFSTSEFLTENNNATGTDFITWGAGWTRN